MERFYFVKEKKKHSSSYQNCIQETRNAVGIFDIYDVIKRICINRKRGKPDIRAGSFPFKGELIKVARSRLT